METTEDVPVVKTVADQTYQHLRRDIVSGELAPGTKLRVEMLSKRYGVGMSPLREALVRLHGEALVLAEGQRGFWVAMISLDELDDTIKTRMLVETEALARSIELGDDAWEERIRTTYAELSAMEAILHGGDRSIISRWEKANTQFHEALVSACASPWLIRMRNMLHYHSERYRMISLANTRFDRDVHDEHEAIMDATLSRKALRACRLIEVHLQQTADSVREALIANHGSLSEAKPKKRRSRTRPDNG